MRCEIARAALEIAPAGALNGLAQTLLRLTAPGVPDLFQGTEFWDFSLVDPDNRRPVDFAARAAALAQGDSAAQLLQNWRDGRIKQRLIACLLNHRQAAPDLFIHGEYQPLTTSGEYARHCLAYMRVWQNERLLVIVPRLIADLLDSDAIPQVAGENGVIPPSTCRRKFTAPSLPASSPAKTRAQIPGIYIYGMFSVIFQ